MGKLGSFFLIWVIMCIDPICTAQNSVQLTDPKLELRDNVIHISYDILNSKTSEFFEIGVDVSDMDGNRIGAHALTGDIGKGVRGGVNKYIHWDLAEDHIFKDEKVYFEVYARAIPQTELVLIDQKGSQPAAGNKEIMSKNYSSAGIVLQSLLIPGLGLSRVTGNPHWIRGLTAYGCLAGSVIMNRQSYKTYNGIEDHIDFDDKYDQLQKSITQDDVSEFLAYAALGIWATDILWTPVGISSFKKRAMSGNFQGRSVRPGIDPLTYSPTIGIKYSF